MGVELTQAGLKSLLSYDPETGVFCWLVSRGRVRAGAVAGNVSPRGYREIQIYGRRYQANQLAWFYMTGVWPAEQVDHRNVIEGDNRWGNLREASNAQNGRNRRTPRHNKSGAKGVSWHSQRGKWRAAIMVNNRHIDLGHFTSIKEAAEAYAAASEKYHGEYGRVN